MTGRFLSRDPEDGCKYNSASLHKYLYAGGDPVNAKDPTGQSSIAESRLLQAAIFTAVVATYYAEKTDPNAVAGALSQLAKAENCAAEYIACALTTLADKRGRVIGESRCQTCHGQCLALGYWPSGYMTRSGYCSCEYLHP